MRAVPVLLPLVTAVAVAASGAAEVVGTTGFSRWPEWWE